ncbi:MAG: NAD(P)/FAD-dependent oxidoreductase, partial [Paracoccaceae bacterium]
RPRLDGPLGVGVKGQAVRLRPAQAICDWRERPLLYDDGVYVVPHADGTLAVGGASWTAWSEPDRPEPGDAAFLERARALCPALEGAATIEWWAGVRPKCRRRDPVVGRLPEELTGGAPLWLATGGFKIGLALAHQTARALARQIIDPSASAVPPELAPSAHAIGSARPGLAADGR